MANFNLDQVKPTKHEAICSLKPEAEFAILSDGSIKWDSSGITQPTTSEIDAEVTRLETEWNNKKYQRDRVPQYPNIGDQLDALYHAGAFPADMAAKIKKVKDDNPKS